MKDKVFIAGILAATQFPSGSKSDSPPFQLPIIVVTEEPDSAGTFAPDLAPCSACIIPLEGNCRLQRATLPFLLTCTLALVSTTGLPQCAPVSANLPAFDAATIKPPGAGDRKAGFYGEPGGRVFFGGSIKMLVETAFNLQDFQVVGGPDWTASQWFEINAVPPETSLSLNIKVPNAEPTSEQRLMLQSLLADRFGLRCHLGLKNGGEVYILSCGTRPLELKPPKDPASDPRAIVVYKQGGIADGEAIGNNTSTDYLALRLGYYLKRPVLNQTGITGSYDYYWSPDDPDNQDRVAAVLHVVDRLGLKLKRGRGPIPTLVIDHIEQPSGN